MNYELFDPARQCCDADAYLSLGYRCAQTNTCYDELRPIGDAVWFSLPYRFGMGEVLLVYLQLLLVAGIAITVWLLVRGKVSSPARQIGSWMLALLLLAWQLWSTFFNTLADTPASLLLIQGILLVLLASRRQSGGLFFLAGIFIGSSTLLRAAYFNPVGAAGLLFLLCWFYHVLLKRQKHLFNTLLVMSFTLPMSGQFYATWKNMGQWSFLSADQTQTQLADHLKSAVVGYDTLLIESSYYWAPPCRPSKGVWNGLREDHLDGLYCLLSQRLFFYLGSYAPHTFYGSERKNLISNGFAEEIGNVSAWSLHNMESEMRSGLSPAGDMKASRLSPSPMAGDADHYFESTSLTPLHPGHYRYSLWLWLPATASPRALDVLVLNKTLSPQTLDWQDTPLLRESIQLTDQPRQFSFDIDNNQPGYLATRIGSIGEAPATDLPDFFAWGAMLEPAANASGYLRSHTPLFGKMGELREHSGHERIFSQWLLLANGLLIVIGFFYLWQRYQRTASPACFFIATLLFMILGEAFLILPEQRFLQGTLATFGILACLFLASFGSKGTSP